MSIHEPQPAGLERGRRLCVDVGSVRVGVAMSDPDGIVATPVETLARDMKPAPGGHPTDIAALAEHVQEHSVRVVYIGLPMHLSGAEGAASAAARTYASQVATAVAPVPVRLVDERMSTVSAHQALHASGRSGRKHRAVVDQVAAVVILQATLDAEHARGMRVGELI